MAFKVTYNRTLVAHSYNFERVCLVCPVPADDHVLQGLLVAIIISQLLLILSGDIELNPGPSVNNLNIWYSNVRSLNHTKLLSIKSEIANEFDIIALTETFLHQNSTCDLNLDGYHPLFRKDRANRFGGGVAAYISESVIAKRLEEFEIDNLEAMWLEIRSTTNTFLLCICYRPPDSAAEFWENLQDSVDLAIEAGHTNIFMTGDFNADPRTENGRKLELFSVSNNFNLHVDTPTRITETSATILDQFISSDSMHNTVKETEILPPLANCDHCSLSVTLQFVSIKNNCFHRLVWKYADADFDGFRTALKNYNWNSCFENNDVNISATKWTDSFLNIARQFIPNYVANIRPWDKPWYSNNLRRLRRQRDRAHRTAKRSSSPADWQRYRQLRNQYVHSLEETEKEYELKLVNRLRSDKNISPRCWWNTTKSLLGVNKKTPIPALLDSNNTLVNDDKSKAGILNDLFLQYSRINTDNAHLPPPEPLTDTSLETVSLAEEEVLALLKTINISKATGPDKISPRMLKEAAPSIASSLTRLFNMSLTSCTFPAIWKRANVIPLHKKGNRNSPNNYRPISLLSVVGKLLEKAIFKYVFNHLRDHDLFTPFQSGFMPNDSTVNQLVHLYHVFCEALDQKKKVRIVFCDISKAFDRVWHEGLLYKLRNMGIGGNLHRWFVNYLHCRQQRVVINGKESDWGLIPAGVPQGSVLGPLLFLVYINDISAVTQANISLFADDTCLYVDSCDNVSNTRILQRDLESLENWANQWLITFSPEKTKSMNLTLNPQESDNNTPLYLSQTPLDEVHHYKHLGLYFSENLKWNQHIKYIVEKAGKRINVMNQLRLKLDRKTLETIYVAFVRPILEYGDVVFDNCTAECKQILESLQKRAGKIVTGAIRGTPSDLLYAELNWKPLEVRRSNHKIIFFSKIVHKTAPPYLQYHQPTSVHERTHYNLRSQNNLTPYPARTNIFSESFFPAATRLWNNLDDEIKQISDPNYLKSILEKNSEAQNPYYYLGHRKFQIIMSRLRMLCSDLSDHLHRMHIIDNPHCACGQIETTEHYFLYCPLFTISRRSLERDTQNLNIPLTINIILNGLTDHNNTNNCKNRMLASSVHEYISSSHRFPLLTNV